jgi:hypothetical protein
MGDQSFYTLMEIRLFDRIAKDKSLVDPIAYTPNKNPAESGIFY